MTDGSVARFRLVDGYGKTIAMPPANKHWEKRDDAIKAIADVQANLDAAKPTDVRE
jgi:hypothetical protein